MSKFTVISPSTAIDRIIARGFNPMQFITRAYRDHSLEWARQFEALACLYICHMLGHSAAQTVEYCYEDVEMELLVEVASRTEWICHQQTTWLTELSEIVFNDMHEVKDLDKEWGFTCYHNYQFSNLMNSRNCQDIYHSCKI